MNALLSATEELNSPRNRLARRSGSSPRPPLPRARPGIGQSCRRGSSSCSERNAFSWCRSHRNHLGKERAEIKTISTHKKRLSKELKSFNLLFIQKVPWIKGLNFAVIDITSIEKGEYETKNVNAIKMHSMFCAGSTFLYSKLSKMYGYYFIMHKKSTKIFFEMASRQKIIRENSPA